MEWHQRTDDATALRVLSENVVWAVVGCSDDPYRASHDIFQVLLAHGYDAIPVNPLHDEVLGHRCYPDLASIGRPVDVVDIFRRSELAGPHVDEAVAVGAKAVWTQLDVWPERASIERAEAAGLTVVLNRCPAQDLPRLLPNGIRAS